MKKRLLSAFLALAMVLTLLPAAALPAFALDYADPGSANPDDIQYTDAQGNPHRFAEAGTTPGSYNTVTVQYCTQSDNTTKREAGNWYWLDNKTSTTEHKYYAVTSGIVAGVGGSGLWYPSQTEFTTSTTNPTTGTTYALRSTSFTLLGNTSLNMSSNTWTSNSLTVDFAGTGTLTVPQTLTNLNATAKYLTGGAQGQVAGLSFDRKAFPTPPASTPRGVTVTATNVNFQGGISLEGRNNGLTLHNCTVAGNLKLDGTTFNTAAAQTAGIADGHNPQRLTTDQRTVITGTIDIDGDGSTVSLTDTYGNAGAATGAMTVTGNGGTVTVGGVSNIGNITLETRSGANSQVPSLTLNGGNVGAVVRTNNDSTTQNQVTINAGATAASVESKYARLAVNQGTITTHAVIQRGDVTLSGPVVVGSMNLGNVSTTNLSISGNGNRIGRIDVNTNKGSNLHIAQWPTGRDNYFGILQLDNYQERGVKGGTFAKGTGTPTMLATLQNPSNVLWFDSSLQFVLEKQGVDETALYSKDEMARAISDVTSAVASGTTEMFILGHAKANQLLLTNGNITWAKIGYDKPVGMILPNEINGFSIAKWFSGENKSGVPSGSEQTIPLPSTGNTFTLKANDVNPTIAKSITNVVVANSTGVENQNVKVALNGNTITLSGAITPTPGSNIANINLDLTTDALDPGGPNAPASGTYVKLTNVQVFYNVDTKAVGFNRLQTISGNAIINDAGELVLNNGTGEHYTITANLTQSASALILHSTGNEVKASVGGKLSSRTQADKDRIISWLADMADDASFEIGSNRAVLEAINAVQATITSNNSVKSWVTAAQNYVWRNGNSYLTNGKPNNQGYSSTGTLKPHTGNFSTEGTFGRDGLDIAAAYDTAYIIPYLQVTATEMSDNGTLTATLTVYYRIDISKAGGYNPNEYYTAQQGRALGNLDGDMSTPVKVKFSSTGAPFAGTTYMHQDGKYVYTKDADGKWSIDHAGTGGGSLGTIVLNMTDGPITLKRANSTTEPTKYDDLQAAIDDTRPGWVTDTSTGDEALDEITIGGTYTPTSCTVTMSGVARKIKVVSVGNRTLTSNTKDVDVQTLNGFNYTIQLKKDAVATGTVAIAVTSTGNGTLSANRSTAKPGEIVTITTIPTAGQAVSSISAKTNSGANVSVTSTGVANQYRFTVPQNATSVTVTASFGVATAANLTITSSNYGLAATSSTQVYAGQEVTITTTPYTGYRATGVTVTTNAGTMTATRTADNVYKFTVPANATYVTVTPTFAADTGLPFVDVPANDFYLDAVKFVYEKGLMNGITATTFGGSRTITRGQIVTILYRLSGTPAASNTSSFQDVPADEYYAPAITWAASNAIVNGRSSTTFAPNDAITRQELAAILYRYTSFRGLTNNKLANLSGYTDQGQVDGYAVTPMQWCVGNGIINGTSNTTLTPRGTAQRYQAAIMLMRYCQAFLNM